MSCQWLERARGLCSIWMPFAPPGGLNEPEPGALASREDTNEVDAHHACGRHLRRRVHRPGGACASGRHVTTPNVAPKVSIVDQLEKIGVKVEQVKHVGISHYHADHTG